MGWKLLCPGGYHAPRVGGERWHGARGAGATKPVVSFENCYRDIKRGLPTALALMRYESIPLGFSSIDTYGDTAPDRRAISSARWAASVRANCKASGSRVNILRISSTWVMYSGTLT